MFKILSLKKYKMLKSAEKDIVKKCEEILELADERIKHEKDERLRAEAERDKARDALYEYRTVLHDTREELDVAGAESAKYKNLYADEVHKRLCLAEKVSSLEQTIKDLEFNLRKTEDEIFWMIENQ